MIAFLESLSSFIVTHSLIIGAAVFIALRQKLSRQLSQWIVRKYFAEPTAERASARRYAGWYDQLTHYIPDVIEDKVMQRAREANVSRQVRLQFLELVIGNAFLLVIAIGLFLSGLILTALRLMSLSAFTFLIRLIIYGILIQNAYKAYRFRNLLSLAKLKELYGEYRLNLIRFTECQIAAVVYRQACRQIDESVRKMGALERFVYRNFSDGTHHYAHSISRRVLDENRRFIRLILGLAALSAGVYYIILCFIVAPAVWTETHRGLFSFLFAVPFEKTGLFVSAHPWWLLILAVGALAAYHYRWKIFLWIAPVLERILKAVA